MTAHTARQALPLLILLAAFLLPASATADDLDASSGSVAVTASVREVHVVIMADDGSVSEIWSNSSDPRADVVFRSGSLNGPEIAATAQQFAAYLVAAANVDWAAGRGRVYQHTA